MPSANFNSFLESYFSDGYMTWHDGLDEEALLSLKGEERDEAERLLIEALPSNDYRPIAGLSSLSSVKAVPWIRANLPRMSGRSLVESASLLWKVEKDPAAVNMLTKHLNSKEFWSSRIDAAFALRAVRTAGSVAALETALNDPEGLVRHHAANALLDIYGIYSDLEELSKDILASHPLSIAIMSDDKTKRQEAVTALKKLIHDRGKIEFEA